MAFNPSGIEALSELLKPPGDDDSSSDDENYSAKKSSAANPGNIGPPRKTERPSGPANSQQVKNSDIWNEEDIPEGGHGEDEHDPRPAPEYELVFKQAVTSEDMYLQMRGRNPSSSSCEDLVIKIKLPDTEYSDVNLDVSDTFLDCRTPKYKLGLFLPHPVDSKNGKAQWDKSKGLLTVTVRLVREYDFLTQ
ncbi:protein PIH1D3-like isoform X2 [Orbicella faveolata]|uniref:protein PIH1D3-like isoform X1 n=1 Tax=Orbicella faveolata TaxID=48498 RepID=UPI0009E2A188|nr:protein PIH1D3-like isoform X1 [Orbicella faveolata]XP_020608529.1 protein PIH1D3-like isoform X2 [Orbicella faveolata]